MQGKSDCAQSTHTKRARKAAWVYADCLSSLFVERGGRGVRRGSALWFGMISNTSTRMCCHHPLAFDLGPTLSNIYYAHPVPISTIQGNPRPLMVKQRITPLKLSNMPTISGAFCEKMPFFFRGGAKSKLLTDTHARQYRLLVKELMFQRARDVEQNDANHHLTRQFMAVICGLTRRFISLHRQIGNIE